MGKHVGKPASHWPWLWGLNALVLLSLVVAVGALYIPTRLTHPEGRSALPYGPYLTVWVLLALVTMFCVSLLRQARKLGRVQEELVESQLQEQSLRSHLLEISSLFDASQQAQAQLELKPMLAAIAQRLLACLDVDAVSVFLMDRSSRTLRCAAAAGADVDFVRSAELRVGEGIAGYAAQNNQPVVVDDDPRSPFAATMKSARAIYAGLCVPVAVRDEVIGVLNVTRIERRRKFTTLEIRLLGVFAGHLGVTIQRARDLEALGARARVLEKAQEAKAGFLSALNHEVRTPLTSVLAYAQLLEEKGEGLDSERRVVYYQTLLEQARRLREALEEMQELYMLEGAAAEDERGGGALHRIVEESASGLSTRAAAREVRLELALDPADPVLERDAARLRRGFQAFLWQVIKHCARRSCVRIVTRHDAACLDGPRTTLAVEVTGDGPGLFGASFDPLERSERYLDTDGLRWATYLLSDLIESMGGRLRVEGQAGLDRISLAIPTRRSRPETPGAAEARAA